VFWQKNSNAATLPAAEQQPKMKNIEVRGFSTNIGLAGRKAGANNGTTIKTWSARQPLLEDDGRFAIRSKTGQGAPEKPDIVIHCPDLRSGTFDDVQAVLAKITDSAREESETAGKAVPNIVLFAENGLRYCFEIDEPEARKRAEEFLLAMPTEIPFALCFNVLCTISKNIPEQLRPIFGYGDQVNMGYVVSQEAGVQFYPKKGITDFEKMRFNPHCAKISFTYPRFATDFKMFQRTQWENRIIAGELEQLPYPELSFDGTKLHYRLCCDVGFGPIKGQNGAIALVSAYDLDESQAHELVSSGVTVLVNDGSKGAEMEKSF